MSDRVTAHKLARDLGIGVTTIKEWAKQLKIGDRDKSGFWVFDEREAHLLQSVHAMREAGNGFDTITRKLGPIHGGDEPDTYPSGAGEVPDRQQALVAQVIDAISQQNELAKMYGQAAHTIGGLEKEVEYLKVQLSESKQLLTDGGQQLESAHQKLVEKDRQIEALRLQLDQSQEKLSLIAKVESAPWWRKILGQ